MPSAAHEAAPTAASRDRGVIEALIKALGADRVTTDPDVLARYAHDEAAWAPYHLPAAMVRPRHTAEVQAVVAACAAAGLAVVTRGAGTGLSGGANATARCVVVSLEAMTSIVEIDRVEHLAVVQPGVVNDDLRRAAIAAGMWYPPDPASSAWSTIGGNVATNAGGLCCVKYGVTRDYVLGMEVVVGRGEVVRLGRRTAKGVVGYDLCGLMVGSEGTLGVVTEVTLRLRPGVPGETHTVVGYFADLRAAGEAVAAVGGAGVVPSALELVDQRCLAAVDDWKHMGLSYNDNVLLLGRSDAPGEAGEVEAATLLRCFNAAGATYAVASTDSTEADALFEARRLAYPAVERLGPRAHRRRLCPARCGGRDVGPHPSIRGRPPNGHRQHRPRRRRQSAPVDHHPTRRPRRRHRAQAAFDDIIEAALDLGGTVSGEHGVGLLKRRGLRRELSPVALAMNQAVKAALDPLGIFNRGRSWVIRGPIRLQPRRRPTLGIRQPSAVFRATLSIPARPVRR